MAAAKKTKTTEKSTSENTASSTAAAAAKENDLPVQPTRKRGRPPKKTQEKAIKEDTAQDADTVCKSTLFNIDIEYRYIFIYLFIYLPFFFK
jgi:hypothetical protein